MKGRYIFIMLVLLLSVCSTLPSVLSHDFDFNTPYTLLNNTQLYTDTRLKAWQNLTSPYRWFTTYTTVANELLYLNVFDTSFISQTTLTQNCGDKCYYGDCNWLSGTSKGNIIECIAWETNGARNSKIYRYFVNNGTWSEIATATDGTATKTLDDSATVNDYFLANDYSLKLWFQTTSSANPEYTKTNSISSTFTGDGTITLPLTFQDPSDMQLAYCNGYYHIIVAKLIGGNTGVYDLVYSKDGNGKPDVYQTYYTLQEPSWNVLSTDYGIKVESNSFMNVAIVNRTIPTPQIALSRYSCNSDGSMTLIYSKVYNQTDIEPTANTTANYYIASPFLTKDVYGVYHLFYEYRQNSYYQLKVSQDATTCSCSIFHATGECDGSFEKFNRTCSPSGCNTTVEWSMTDTCIAGETCTPNWECYNATARAYKELDCTFTNVTACSGLTPYCYGGSCVGECVEGYYCSDTTTRAFSTSSCQVSEILNCNSTGDGYCTGGRCQTIQTPAFNVSDSTLDIIEQMTGSVKTMLSWIAKPTFVILLAMAVTILIIGVFTLIGSIGERATRRGR